MTARSRTPYLAAVAVSCAALPFLIAPARYAESVSEGISLWALTVVPAVFPLLFLTALFTGLPPFRRAARILSPVAGRVFRVSGESACVALLAALSGYPVGARSLADLAADGRLGGEESLRAACLVTTSGPAFVAGAVGAGMFRSAAAGWALLLSHFLAVWTVCFFLRFTGKPLPVRPPRPRQGNTDLYGVLTQSVLSMLCVGGSIALFSALGQAASDAAALAGLKDPFAAGLLRGLFEMTTGCRALAAGSSPLALPAACFLVTFGGACVLLQQAVFLSRAGVKLLPFFLIKPVQGGLAFLLCAAVCALFGV